MNREGYIYDGLCSIDNITLADTTAQKGKREQRGVIKHNGNVVGNRLAIQWMLVTETFTTSKYNTFQIREPKVRTVFSLPFSPDRIVQHNIMLAIKNILVATFTADTYSCIEGRGVHAAVNKIKKVLKDRAGTEYCLKLDIKQFYPSVNHDILKALLRRKFKDRRLLRLLDGIIDSAPGLPIGNYLSQYFANFYLTYFDHWLKETKRVKYYFRYADDIVIFSDSKPQLHALLADIREYLSTHLDLTIKENYQVFPVAARGVDFLGYVFYHTHTLLRKRIKKNMCRMLANNPNPASIASYRGWCKHCNARNLEKKVLPKAA